MALNCSSGRRVVLARLILVGSGGRGPLILYQDKKNKVLSNETTPSRNYRNKASYANFYYLNIKHFSRPEASQIVDTSQDARISKK